VGEQSLVINRNCVVKLLAVNSARAIWLVKTIFLNPRGRSLVAAMVGLAERYKFTKLPPAASLGTQPLDLKFENGTFMNAAGIPIAVNLSVFDDGLIAETRSSTEESDNFLDDVLAWVSQEFGLPHHSELEVDRIYASELMVRLDLSNSLFGARFAPYAAKLREGISNNPQLPMELIAMHFGPDPRLTKKVASFKVERAANVPFEKNEYYSAAPIPTAEHIELLEAMERFGSK
jgi:hypothetical protein